MTCNVHAGVGPGKFRDPWAIRRFLSERGLNMSALARALEISPQAVQETVRGTRNTRKVLARLLEMGCPHEVLSLPDDLKPISKESAA